METTIRSRKVLPAVVAGVLLAAAAFAVLAICGGASALAKEKTAPLDPAAANCLVLAESAMAEYFDAPHKTMTLSADFASQFFDRVREASPDLQAPPSAVTSASFVREDGSTVALGLFSFEGTMECGFATIPVEVLGQWSIEVLGRQV